MHDSMMIAEVGDIVKVSGSRMATPFAPPRPGSTPIRTPRVMPTSISSMFIGVSTTPKPWKRALSSVMERWCDSVAAEGERIDGALEQRHLEPDLEHEEEDGGGDHGHGHALGVAELSQHDHEDRDVDRRRDVHPEQRNHADEQQRGHQHDQHAPELLVVDEDLGVALPAQ